MRDPINVRWSRSTEADAQLAHTRIEVLNVKAQMIFNLSGAALLGLSTIGTALANELVVNDGQAELVARRGQPEPGDDRGNDGVGHA